MLAHGVNCITSVFSRSAHTGVNICLRPRIEREHMTLEISRLAKWLHRGSDRKTCLRRLGRDVCHYRTLPWESQLRSEKNTHTSPKALLISKQFHSFHQNLSVWNFHHVFYCYDGKIINFLRLDLIMIDVVCDLEVDFHLVQNFLGQRTFLWLSFCFLGKLQMFKKYFHFFCSRIKKTTFIKSVSLFLT